MSSRQNFDFLDRLIYKIINIKQTKNIMLDNRY